MNEILHSKLNTFSVSYAVLFIQRHCIIIILSACYASMFCMHVLCRYVCLLMLFICSICFFMSISSCFLFANSIRLFACLLLPFICSLRFVNSIYLFVSNANRNVAICRYQEMIEIGMHYYSFKYFISTRTVSTVTLG